MGCSSSWLWKTSRFVITMTSSLQSVQHHSYALFLDQTVATTSQCIWNIIKVAYSKPSLPVLQTLQSKGHEGRRHNDRDTGCQVRSSVLVIRTHCRSRRNVLIFKTSAACITYSWLEFTYFCNCIPICNWLECIFPPRTSFAFLETI